MFVYMLVTQLCLTLCDPMDFSPLGSSEPGILQARILEWVAISFSKIDVYRQRFQQIFIDYPLCASYELCVNYSMVNKKAMSLTFMDFRDNKQIYKYGHDNKFWCVMKKKYTILQVIFSVNKIRSSTSD